MPNHVHTTLKFNDFKVFHEARKVLVNDEGYVDFSILIPKPITVYCGDLSGMDSDDFGDMTWYKWSVANWGTKWNAYDSEVSVDELTISFETAWDIPRPIIVALANSLKDGTFTHHYLCEWTEWWGVEEWEGGTGRRTRVSRENPEEFKEIFLMSHGQEGWDQAVEYAKDDGDSWPPEHVLNSKPEQQGGGWDRSNQARQ